MPELTSPSATKDAETALKSDLQSIFAYDCYKDFVNTWVQNQPKGGYGQASRFAHQLNIHPVQVSQVLKGDRHFTLEQAQDLLELLGLDELEEEYFLTLVMHSKAAKPNLRLRFAKQLQRLRRQAHELSRRRDEHTMLEEEKTTFYSHPDYSAVRLATDLPIGADADRSLCTGSQCEQIARLLNLPAARVQVILEFLLAAKLVIENPQTKTLSIGPRLTHIDRHSPQATSHRTQWRLKGLQHLQEDLRGAVQQEAADRQPDDLFYSGPMALSSEDAAFVRARCTQLIRELSSHVAHSPRPSDRLFCLNLDWFRFDAASP